MRKDSLDREVIEHIRLLPDVVIFPSILMKGMNCIQVNEPLTFYRKHDANTTSSLYREDLAEFTLEEGQFWLEYVGGKSINLEKQARALLLKRSFPLLVRYLTSSRSESCFNIGCRNFKFKDLVVLVEYEMATNFISADIFFGLRNVLLGL